MRAYRRLFDHEHRTTRWNVRAKIGTQPYPSVWMDRKPTVGAKRYCWAGNGHEWYVTIEEITPDGLVKCSWR